VTHDAVPTVTFVACWSLCKDPLLPESNEDGAVWVADRQLAAVFDGATESFAARRWVNIVRREWASGSPLNLEALQREYADHINAMELSWAQESAAGRGSFTTVASIVPAPGGLSATCVGDSAILLVKDGKIAQAYPSMDPMDYSSVPDALGSTKETLSLGQELIQTCSWTIPVEPDEFDLALLATDAVAMWLLEGNEAQPNERLTSARAVSDDAAWEHLVTHEREAGHMKTDDSTLVVVSIEVPA
jgi:serine/threonine protein phosphatase PrpC